MPSHSFLMLSTGEISPLNNSFAVVESYDSQAGNGNNGNLDAGGMPDPMTPISSPGTSEMARTVARAPPTPASRPPPLIRDR